MTDYWLSKLLFDLQTPDHMNKWKHDPYPVLKHYPLDEKMKNAVLSNDLETMAPHVNPYLLRFYFSLSGMTDAELLARLHAMKPEPEEVEHG